MSLVLVMKLVHVLAVFWFIGGMIGRTITQQAAHTSNFETMQTLMRLNDIFEKRRVIPGSMLVFIVGVIAAILGGWSLFGFL